MSEIPPGRLAARVRSDELRGCAWSAWRRSSFQRPERRGPAGTRIADGREGYGLDRERHRRQLNWRGLDPFSLFDELHPVPMLVGPDNRMIASSFARICLMAV
ncbi:MAG TPA: hypothetical protein VFZ69_15155 [Longimicrobiales bacterium]